MTIPVTPGAVLVELRRRGVDLVLEKTTKVGPRGYRVPSSHLWARGPVTSQDWERVRRHREALVKLLEKEQLEEPGALPPPAEMAIHMLYPDVHCGHPRLDRAGMTRSTVA